MTRLTFSGGRHEYLLDKGTKREQRLPSVTTLTGQLDKPALKNWAGKVTANYAVDHWDELAKLAPSARQAAIAAAQYQTLSKAAAKGIAIHAMAEQLLAGNPVEVPDELAGKVQGLAKWIEASKIEVLHTEAMVWSDHDPEFDSCGYAGTLDAIAEHPRYGCLLVDWKTGSGVYGNMADQLVGYASAEWIVHGGQDQSMPHIDTLAVAHVRPDGTDLHVLDDEQRESAYRRFQLLRALRLAQEASFQMEATA